MKFLPILFLLSSCTIVPMYRLEKNEYCRKDYYDKICEGTDKSYNYYPNSGRGIYE